jgi:hypothetical protein
MAIWTADGRPADRSSAHRALGWPARPWCSSRRARAWPGVGASGMARTNLPAVDSTDRTSGKDHETSRGCGPVHKGLASVIAPVVSINFCVIPQWHIPCMSGHDEVVNGANAAQSRID